MLIINTTNQVSREREREPEIVSVYCFIEYMCICVYWSIVEKYIYANKAGIVDGNDKKICRGLLLLKLVGFKVNKSFREMENIFVESSYLRLYIYESNDEDPTERIFLTRDSSIPLEHIVP